MNLLLDVVTRARLGTASYGREGAITKLGLDREHFQAKQDEVFAPLVESLLAGKEETEVLEGLREAVKSLGVRKPSRLSDENEATVRLQLSRLAARLKEAAVIPGLTVFQAKGREWERVGVVLSRAQLAALASGLRALEEEHCIIYVAITRAKRFCGQLSGTSEHDVDSLPLDV
jgi:DNA helicase-2/ATP-dependent DNA helicase PcrA